MNRLEFIVLSILCSHGATSKFHAMTIYEIQQAENLDIKPNTYYKLLQKLVELGAVSAGAKDGKSNTYYITITGEKMIEEARN